MWLTQKREIKVVELQNFRKIAKLRCREICEPQIREIKVSRKFHVIRGEGDLNCTRHLQEKQLVNLALQ